MIWINVGAKFILNTLWIPFMTFMRYSHPQKNTSMDSRTWKTVLVYLDNESQKTKTSTFRVPTNPDPPLTRPLLYPQWQITERKAKDLLINLSSYKVSGFVHVQLLYLLNLHEQSYNRHSGMMAENYCWISCPQRRIPPCSLVCAYKDRRMD